MLEQINKETKDKMIKALESFQRELTRMRGGRASLSMLEEVKVDYYGQITPLNQVATLAAPEPRLLTVAPWQSNLIPQIEKGIRESKLGLNPVNDGKVIRIPIPPLTEERRKELVKVIKNHTEEARVVVRHARRDAMDEVKKLEKEGKVTEDDSKKASVVIQKLTDDHIALIEESAQKKEKEIMTV